MTVVKPGSEADEARERGSREAYRRSPIKVSQISRAISMVLGFGRVRIQYSRGRVAEQGVEQSREEVMWLAEERGRRRVGSRGEEQVRK